MQRKTVMKFQAILESNRKQLLLNANLASRNFGIERDDLFDETDQAISDLAQGMKMRLGNREALYLKKIEAAFQRIQDGTYGECVSCGGDIGERRLEARPTADLCIDCKEESERSENLSAEGRKPKSVGASLYDLRAIAKAGGE